MKAFLVKVNHYEPLTSLGRKDWYIKEDQSKNVGVWLKKPTEDDVWQKAGKDWNSTSIIEIEEVEVFK